MNGNYPHRAVRGMAALMQALNTIGYPEGDDTSLAKIIVDNETALRNMIDLCLYGLEKWGEEPFRG